VDKPVDGKLPGEHNQLSTRHFRSQSVQKTIRMAPTASTDAIYISPSSNPRPRAEITAAPGCSAKAVETRIYRARQQLREGLAADN